MNRTRITVVLLAVVLLTSPVPAVGAVTVSNGQASAVLQSATTINGVELDAVAKLWAGDEELAGVRQLEAYQTILSRTGADASDVDGRTSQADWNAVADTPTEEQALTALSLAQNGDFTFESPPRNAQTWTRQDFDDLSTQLSFDRETSYRPTGATTRNRRHIRDAHVTTYAVTPSTVSHRRSGETRYIAPEGRYNALVDYRVAVPSDTHDTNPPGPPLETWTSYRLQSHSIQWVAIEADGTELVNRSGTHTPDLPYDLGSQNPRTLTIRAKITSTIKRTDKEKKKVKVGEEECSDFIKIGDQWFEVTDWCDVYEKKTFSSTTEIDSSVVVTNTIPISTYRLQSDDVQGWQAERPTGETEVRVGVDGVRWAGYTATRDGGNIRERVQTNVRFYTARNQRWDTLTKTTASRSQEITSPAHPVLVHAYRDREGISVSHRVISAGTTDPEKLDRPTNVQVWGPERTPGEVTDHGIGRTVAVNRRRSPYTQAAVLGARHPKPPEGRITVRGLVLGENVRIDTATLTTRPVRKPAINATVNPAGPDETSVTARLEDDSGTAIPIETRPSDSLTDDANGKLVVQANNSTEITSASGTQSVGLHGSGLVEIEYEPTAWVSADPRDGWTSTVYVDASGSYSAGHITSSWVQTRVTDVVIALLPIGLLFWTWRSVRRIVFRRRHRQ